jgi:formylglycine-generating enzyme required for sulfatase activity
MMMLIEIIILVEEALEVFNFKKKNMKNISFVLLFILFSNSVKASNLNIGASTFNETDNTLSFTISWDYSWRLTSGPSNWDAVWIFVKRQNCNVGTTNQAWAHQLLSTNSVDHATSIASGTNLLTVDAVSDGVGVFIRRSALTTATGNIETHTIVLKLNTSANNTNPAITTSATDNFKVMGFEMVYVPQGSYYLGDGRSTNTTNFCANGQVSSALLIDATTQTNGLGASSNYTSNVVYGCPNSLPNTYPIGYNGFYTMKYELTTAAYVDFLNTLNYDQQDAKFEKMNNSAYHPNTTSSFLSFSDKGNINVPANGVGIYNTKPATFTFNTTWASFSACHYLLWKDLAAYLDWAGLRPMSEFEFEKACRGNNGGTPNSPIEYEYPWGNTLITNASNPNSRGTINESAQNLGSQGLSFWNYNNESWLPARGGATASANSNRSQAGATYYGIMDMGGNVWEQCVGGGSAYDYSTFRENVHGDGALDNMGLANVNGWPISGGTSSGTIVKGGAGLGANCCVTTYVQVSDRTFHGGNNYNGVTNQGQGFGGRGVRTMSY